MPYQGPKGKYALHIPKKQFAKTLGQRIVRGIWRRGDDVPETTRALVADTVTELSESWEKELLDNFLSIERFASGIAPGLHTPVVVDALGGGDFTTLQAAFDYASDTGGNWVWIVVSPNGHKDTNANITASWPNTEVTQVFVSGPMSITSLSGAGYLNFINAQIDSTNTAAWAAGFVGTLGFFNSDFTGDSLQGVVSGSDVTLHIQDSIMSGLVGVAGGTLQGYARGSTIIRLCNGSISMGSWSANDCNIFGITSGGGTITATDSATINSFTNCRFKFLESGTVIWTAHGEDGEVWNFDGNTIHFGTSGTWTFSGFGDNTHLNFNNNEREDLINGLFTLTINTIRRCYVSIEGNNLANTAVVITGTNNAHVRMSGTYGSLNNTCSFLVADVVLVPLNGVANITHSGNSSIIDATFFGGAATGLVLSGNNNFLTIGNLGTFSNSGTNNSINGSGTVDTVHKDLIPGLLIDPNGVNNIPPLASTGAVAGSLAGSLPNPIFAGRDSSVDKLNQDLLPALLASPNGVQNTPIPGALGLEGRIATITANQSGIGGSFTDITGATLTRTLSSLRRYKITWAYGAISQQTLPGIPVCAIFSGASQNAQTNLPTTAAGNQAGSSPTIAYVTGNDTSTVYKVQGLTTAGTFNLSASSAQPAYFTIEDVGVA